MIRTIKRGHIVFRNLSTVKRRHGAFKKKPNGAAAEAGFSGASCLRRPVEVSQPGLSVELEPSIVANGYYKEYSPPPSDALDLGLSLSIRDRLRKWEEEEAPDRVWTMTENSDRSIILNEMYKATALSGLREGRESGLADSHDSLGFDVELDTAIATNLAGQLNPGTLIEIRPNDQRSPVLGVILCHLKGVYYFLSDGGQLLSSNSLEIPTVLFCSQNLAPLYETKDMVDYLRSAPEEKIRPEALYKNQPDSRHSIQLRRRLQSFRKKATELYQNHLSILLRAETLVPHETETKTLSLEEIIDALLPNTLDVRVKKSPEFLYAVHSALLTSPTGAFRNLNALQKPASNRSDMYVVMSKHEIQVAYGIRDQVRTIMAEIHRHGGVISDHGELDDNLSACRPVWNFVRKAKRLVQTSREQRGLPKHGMLPSSSNGQSILAMRTSKEAGWTSEETAILGYLQWWVGHSGDRLSSMQYFVGTCILRFTGMYKSDVATRLDDSTGFLFLKEIGWIPSWELPARYRTLIPGVEPVPGGANGGYRRQKHVDPVQDLGEDVAAGRRKDWSQVTAYAIDSADTTMVDDAISFERADKPGEYWLHVHVADPTAFFRHNSPLADYLATVPQNLYTQGFFAPMFPPAFVDDAIRRWGLGKGQPCLTFSTRLGADGTVLGRRVEEGTLGDVIYMTYEELEKICANFVQKAPLPEGLDRLSIGPTSDERERVTSKEANRQITSAETLSSSQKADLTQMHAILGANQRRRAKGAMNLLQRPKQVTSLLFDADTTPSPWPVDVPGRTTWSADPGITVFYESSSSDGVVSVAMTLASETAARWCHDRQVPVPFLTQPETVSREHQLASLTKALNAFIADGVEPPAALWRSYIALTGTSVVAVEPQPLPRLGVEMYLRVTSPLRRYVDCISHWQIHAALAREAAAAAATGATTSSPARKKARKASPGRAAPPALLLPWTRDNLAAKLASMSFNAACARRLGSDAAGRGWVYQALLRAWQQQQGEGRRRDEEDEEKKNNDDKDDADVPLLLPRRFLFTVHDKFSRWLRGDMGYLGLGATVHADRMAPAELVGRVADARPGDMFEAEIVDVCAFYGRVELKPLRKLSPDEVGAENRRRHGGRDVDVLLRRVWAEAAAATAAAAEAGSEEKWGV